MESTPPTNDQLKKILNDNLVYIQDIYRKVDKLYKHMLWQRVISWIYLAIIVIPIVASFFFLPTLMKSLTSIVDPTGSLQLDKIVVPNSQPTINLNGSSTTDLLKQYQDLLKQIQR